MSAEIVPLFGGAPRSARVPPPAQASPVAREVTHPLPLHFDLVRPAPDDGPQDFVSSLPQRSTLQRFMLESLYFTYMDEAGVSHKKGLLYRDVIAAASLTTLDRFAHTAQEEWVLYARNLFYTAYGLWLTSSGTTPLWRPHQDTGATMALEHLSNRVVNAVRFFDYPLQAAAHACRTSQAAHPLLVALEEGYQNALIAFESQNRHLDMAYVYLHEAGQTKSKPSPTTWFPQW